MCVSKNCFFCRPHRYANGALATDVTSWDSTLALSLTARIFLLFFLLVDLGALHIWSLQLVRLKTFLVLRHSPLNPLSAGHISPQPNHPPFQHLEICISIVSKKQRQKLECCRLDLHLLQSETSEASYLFPCYVPAGLITAKISGNKIISCKMPNTRNRQSNWRPFSNAQPFHLRPNRNPFCAAFFLWN